MAALTERRLNSAFFVAGGVIAVFFWMLDAQSYYYQEKIRSVMKATAESMISRRSARISIPGVGMPVPKEATSAKWLARTTHAAFNGSMFFYYFVIALMVSLSAAHSFGLFGGVRP